MKINSFKNGKHGYLMQYLIRQSFEDKVLLIRIEIMSAVTLNLSIDSILIKLLCRFVNFVGMKKEIYKMIFNKR